MYIVDSYAHLGSQRAHHMGVPLDTSLQYIATTKLILVLSSYCYRVLKGDSLDTGPTTGMMLGVARLLLLPVARDSESAPGSLWGCRYRTRTVRAGVARHTECEYHTGIITAVCCATNLTNR